jgi:hypothetical protein
VNKVAKEKVSGNGKMQDIVKPSSKLEDQWFFWWIQNHWVISSGEFASMPYRYLPNYPFMEALLKDTSPKIVVKKCAQVGLTEINIAKMFAIADLLPGNLMYVLPTDELSKVISRARIKAAHRVNPYLEQYLTGYDTLHQFKFKNNWIYIRGSQTQIKDGRKFRRQLISIDASRLFGDEVDEWQAGVMGSLQSRIGASADPIEAYFSVPRLPDGGISKLYSQSTMMEWAVKCEHCNEWNIELTLTENVTNCEYPDLEHKVVCRKCGKDLNRLEADPRKAQWVARNPTTGKWPGYHFTKLFYRYASIDLIVERYNDPETVQDCYNDDFGEPYEHKQYTINNSDLEKCKCLDAGLWNEAIKNVTNIRMGVDIGKKIHYRVEGDFGEMTLVMDVGSVHHFEDLKALVLEKNIIKGVIDAQPDFRASQEFCEQMENIHDREFKCAYFDTHRTPRNERVLIKEDTHNPYVIVIARNLAMSDVMFKVLTRKVMLHPEAEHLDNGDFYEHMKVPTRVYRQEPATGKMVMVFPPSRKPDHHYMAAVYARCAKELSGASVSITRRGMAL